MPRQNRPLVRDGRIQTKKKRTDRSYLQPDASPPVDAPPSETVEELIAPDSPEAAEIVAEPELVVEPEAVEAPVTPASNAVTSTSVARSPTRVTGAARAIQQQGVRKRRDVDLNALARRDTTYAIHELRRIAALAAMVVVTLIVLGIVLR